jgi:DNA-binding GntR family transcriptional regulator
MTDAILNTATSRYSVPAMKTEEQQQLAERSHQIHVRIVDLIEKKKSAAAQELWRSHLADTEEQVLRILGPATILEIME